VRYIKYTKNNTFCDFELYNFLDVFSSNCLSIYNGSFLFLAKNRVSVTPPPPPQFLDWFKHISKVVLKESEGDSSPQFPPWLRHCKSHIFTSSYNGCISSRNKCNFKLGSAELFPTIWTSCIWKTTAKLAGQGRGEDLCKPILWMYDIIHMWYSIWEVKESYRSKETSKYYVPMY
jgi:hypothetical protein